MHTKKEWIRRCKTSISGFVFPDFIVIGSSLRAFAYALPSALAMCYATAVVAQSTPDGAPNSPSAKSAETTSRPADGRDAENLQEVIVTAQKRTERLQDVPISISVMSGTDIDQSSFMSVTDALSQIPGVVAMPQAQSGGTQITIRGVGASGPIANGSSPIGYYLDSVPFGLVQSAVAPDENAYDLQRIEVLRGPQGTLYGAGGENGVVRVLTNDADLNQFEFKARSTLSTTDGGGENYRGDMAVNVPIIEGKLAIRAVVGYEDVSGWIDSPNAKHINDGELRTYRLKINAQPTDELSIGMSVWSSHDNYGAPSTATDNEHIPAILPQPLYTDYDAYGLKVGYEFPHFTVSSMTSYLGYINGGYLDFTPIGIPANLFTGIDSKVFSQEFILSSLRDSAWRWTAGAIYRDARDQFYQTLGIYFAAPIDYTETSKSSAIFGQFGRRFFNDQLEWTLGLRYFHDESSNKENIQDEGLTGVPLYHGAATYNAPTPRAVLTWYPSSDLTAYVSYSQGFRSGFPQNANTVQSAPYWPTLKPDKLYNYEIGAKADLLDKRISIDTALYYIDWRDVQQTLQVPIGNGVFGAAPVNGQAASGVGVDLAVTTRPLEGLEVGINFGWNNLSLDSAIYAGNILLFSKGDRLNFSPEYTAGGFANYGFPLGGGFKGRFSASANYISKQTTHDPSAPAPTVIETGDTLLIARTSFSIISPYRWTATLFVDNVNNDHAGMPSGDAVPSWDTQVRPRTMGVQLDYHF
jgi:outer membrane receptor protein involved in Fe transport